MHRAVLSALLGSSVMLAAGVAQAQQICCVAQPPPPQVCCVAAQAQAQAGAQAGLRGYAEPTYPAAPYAQQAQYAGGPPPPYAQPSYEPRPVDSGLRGYVGVEYGKARLDPGTPSPRVETWTGEGAVVGQLGNVGIQGDLKVASYNTLNSSDGDGTAWSPTLHAYTKSRYGLIGGWAGWSHTKGADLYGLGVEGQAYFGSATLYGSAGYGHVNSNPNQNLWAGRLEGRYFVTENFMLNLVGGLVEATGGGNSATVRSIGVGAEYQPDILPVSIQGSYTHSDASGSSAQSDTFRIGLRWNFGGGTLADRDRYGPALVNVTDQFSSN